MAAREARKTWLTMLIEMLDNELKKLLIDRLEGWELCEFLQLSIEDVIEAFEDEIIQNLDDVLELAGLRELNGNYNNDDDDTN